MSYENSCEVPQESFITRITGQKWTTYHIRVALHTFIIYALFHANRKTLSTVKPSLIDIWTSNSSTPEGPLFASKKSATEFLGALDTGFMITYALGLYICGSLGDYYNPRRILSLGMALSAITVFIFGYVTEILHFYSITFYSILWISNGFFQSVGWPLVVCIMGSWFGKTSRGTIIGVWSVNASVGNILASLTASQTIHFGYQYPFFIVSMTLFVYSFITFFHLPSAPWEVEDFTEDPVTKDTDLEKKERPPPIGFFRAWLLPGVIAFSISYLCLKLVNDGFFFWLPFYLHNGLHWSESFADALSSWYDVGAIISSILSGALSDRMKSRTLIVFVMLLASTASLLAYAHSTESYYWNAAMLLVVGFFIGGPLNMIAGCITSDLGKAEALRGNTEALSTVTGIIDGTGSVGSAIGQWLIPLVRNWLGWDAIFYGFVIMVVCSALCLSPVLWNQRKENKQQKVIRYGENNQGCVELAEHPCMARVRPLGDQDSLTRLTGQKWTRHHFSVFVHTFFSFAMIHANRKTLSAVKPSLIKAWTSNSTGPPFMETEEHATKFLGVLDTSFMMTYAFGLFVCGTLGDRYNPRKMLCLGMAMSATSVFAFGYLAETFHFYSAPLYVFLWVTNGLSQSVGWPLVVGIMGNWFGHSARGAVMGVWSSCSSVGNIIGTLIASRVLYLGYQFPFVIICLMLFGYSLLAFLRLPSAPWEVELGVHREAEQKEKPEHLNRPPPLGFVRAWFLPGVVLFSLAFACLKFVNDGFFFWLPFYLHNGLHWPETFADALSTWYDVGGIVSSVVAGSLSDRMKSRTSLVFYMLLVSIIALYGYAQSPASYAWNSSLLFVVGFFVGGPINMIASSIVADLGKSEKLRGNSEALSTVTGIIDGTGSLGSAIGQFMIPYIQHKFGWNAIFYVFMAMMAFTALCITLVLLKEQKSRRKKRTKESEMLLGSESSDSEAELWLDEKDVRRRQHGGQNAFV